MKSEPVKPAPREEKDVVQDNDQTVEVDIEIEEDVVEIEESVEAVSEDDSIEANTNTESNTEQAPETPNNEKDTDTMTDTQETQANEAPAVPAYQPAAASAYPGTYPGYAATAAANNAADEQAAEGDRRLTIGRGITMSGEIESCDYLLVEGTVEAALKGASTLEIAESGVFYGTVEIADAEISGRFEGDIVATGRLTLREGATVTGSIAYKELEIEAGAVIDGKLTPLQAVQAAAQKPSATKKAAAPKAKAAVKEAAAEAAPAPANSDGGLFSKAAAVSE
ncbi:MAG: bactofilin family protein [Alphaproteobacteria bacterium]